LLVDIKNTIPGGMYDALGVSDWSWIIFLTNNEETGVLDLAFDDVTDDIRFLTERRTSYLKRLVEGGQVIGSHWSRSNH